MWRNQRFGLTILHKREIIVEDEIVESVHEQIYLEQKINAIFKKKIIVIKQRIWMGWKVFG